MKTTESISLNLNRQASPQPRRTENHYCCGCMKTQAFLDRGPSLQCPTCDRTLERRTAAPRG